MSLNVLVVDDSSTMRAMLRKILQISGVTVENFYEAGNGQEALDLMERQWVDLILVDLNMPVMGGLEMIERVRCNPDLADLPIIVVSSESSQTRITDLEAKGLKFIHKPFRPETVRDLIVQLLGGAAHGSEPGNAGGSGAGNI